MADSSSLTTTSETGAVLVGHHNRSMPLVRIKPLTEIPPGTLAEVEINGTPYAICNLNGKIYCVDGVCPHADGPLAQGALHGSTIVCPWHGWEFDVRTGANELGYDCKLNTYPSSVQDGQIFIQLP